MYERRIYRQRKSGVNAATVLLALAALGLAFLILRPGPDKTQSDRAGVESAALPANDSVADGSSAAAGADQQELSGLRQKVAQASQDLTALRSETEQMRAELSALRQQRKSLAAVVPAASPTPASAPAAQPAPVPVATPEVHEQANVATTQTAATPAKQTTAADTKQTAAAASTPDSAKPPAAVSTAAASEHEKKLPHHPHNAHGYLLTARDALQSGDPAHAEEALERAETWALNNSGDYHANMSPTEDPLVSTVEGMRAELRAGHSTSALRMLESMLSAPRSARAESSTFR